MSNLDMSLDDIIKSNKKFSAAGNGSRGGRGGRGRSGSGPGPNRRATNRANNRPAPYSMGKATDYGVYSDQLAAYTAPVAARPLTTENGMKLYISNLDYGVSNEDIKELFAEVGDLKRYSIHYDRSGRSTGTAEVLYSRKEHALAAVNRYNNVQLDGKPMKIEIVGTNIEKPLPMAPVANGFFGITNGIPKSYNGQGRGGSMVRSRGGGRGQRGGRGRGKGRAAPVSAADLDADLDKYHTESMQIN